jgi:hypothetical protein
MSARADFACIACDEVMELPLKASGCPVCGGLLERRFTAPMVNTDFAKKVDVIADPVLSRPAAPPVPKGAETRIMAPAQALGMVAGDNRLASRGLNAPLINALRGKGPRPIQGV